MPHACTSMKGMIGRTTRNRTGNRGASSLRGPRLADNVAVRRVAPREPQKYPTVEIPESRRSGIDGDGALRLGPLHVSSSATCSWTSRLSITPTNSERSRAFWCRLSDSCCEGRAPVRSGSRCPQRRGRPWCQSSRDAPYGASVVRGLLDDHIHRFVSTRSRPPALDAH